MANKDNNKPDTIKKKKSTSDKKKSPNKKDMAKNDTVKNTKNVIKNAVKKVAEKVKGNKYNNDISEEIVKEKAEPTFEETAIAQIYGEEPIKNATPFPEHSLQTQTRNIINEFAIDITRLPQGIVDAVNSLVNDFSYFITNPYMTNMIPTIMDKDLVALNLLKAWVEPRRALLSELKVKLKGVVEAGSNVKVLPPVTYEQQQQNQNQQVVHPQPIPQNQNSQVTVTNVNQPVQVPPHAQNNFDPRKPENTYQHVPQTQKLHQGNQPVGMGENKNAHNDMMSQANPSILAHNHAQQNLQYNPTPTVVDPEKQFKDYSDSIMETIKATFQIIHWGYIPVDVLQGILASCDKTFSYEIVANGENSYMNISKDGKKIQTEMFAIK